MAKQHEAPEMWREYQRIKLKLIILVLGWLPFGALLLEVSSLNHVLEPVTFLLIPYMVFGTYTLLRFLLYRCPTCSVSFFGGQLHRRTCPKCGIPINK